eukprot:179538-Pyramimonas_sp.AAC.1
MRAELSTCFALCMHKKTIRQGRQVISSHAQAWPTDWRAVSRARAGPPSNSTLPTHLSQLNENNGNDVP